MAFFLTGMPRVTCYASTPIRGVIYICSDGGSKTDLHAIRLAEHPGSGLRGHCIAVECQGTSRTHERTLALANGLADLAARKYLTAICSERYQTFLRWLTIFIACVGGNNE